MQKTDPGEFPPVAVIGTGPAGLMAAEVLAKKQVNVDIYDSMPSAGRKLLMAGKGGLNLTHSETTDDFLSHYGSQRTQLEPYLDAFDANVLQAWVHDLGIETFIGSSNRVFPIGMKTAPLLHAWLERLRELNVAFHFRHKWRGWDSAGILRFETQEGEVKKKAGAVVLALGGGSWKHLGSTGEWIPILAAHGVRIAPLRPSNCGFDISWSAHFRTRFEGTPLKTVTLSFTDSKGNIYTKSGELVITRYGVEGSLIYAFSALLRDEIDAHGTTSISIDLAPGWTHEHLVERLSRAKGSQSFANHLRKSVNIQGVKSGLLHEFVPREHFHDPEYLAGKIKELSIPLIRPRPLDEAISSAGGVCFDQLDEHLMIRNLPGVFCAGEMLDWEAPTGGYLITACLATGRSAGLGVFDWLQRHSS